MRNWLLFFALASALFVAACSDQQSTNDKIRKDAADATQQIKRGAQVAANDVKAESKELGGQAKAAGQGMREGWNRDKNATVDINSAPTAQIAALPGLSDREARSVVQNRPYKAPAELVSKKVLTAEQYQRIQSRVVVGESR